MKTQQQERSILPLDLTSIIRLIESDGGYFAPLSYAIEQSSPIETTIHIDIQQCDPDSINITIDAMELSVSAEASFNFQENMASAQSIDLKRDVNVRIPLAPGISISSIHSKITDDNLIITIPYAN